jgi:7-cyano-7-deazaguanine reductase
MAENPLGESSNYPRQYSPDILYPIPRWPARSLLDIDKKIKMYGIDHWHAYEIYWLDSAGKPNIRIGEFFFNAESENLVESKSLKLYLNSINNEKFAKEADVQQRITEDLSKISQSEVKVVLLPAENSESSDLSARVGRSIDKESISVIDGEPDESFLKIGDDLVFDEELYSDLFRSNCPVTGQPDWASFQIEYTGPKIDRGSLLQYLCSYRNHQGYHEECCERVFRDISLKCRPTDLTISLNFLRRGGLDINVYRSSQVMTSDLVKPRLGRQ